MSFFVSRKRKTERKIRTEQKTIQMREGERKRERETLDSGILLRIFDAAFENIQETEWMPSRMNNKLYITTTAILE